MGYSFINAGLIGTRFAPGRVARGENALLILLDSCALVITDVSTKRSPIFWQPFWLHFGLQRRTQIFGLPDVWNT